MHILSSEQLREIRRVYGPDTSLSDCYDIYESTREKALRGTLDARSQHLAVELDMVVWKQAWKRGEKMWCEVPESFGKNDEQER
jgi:hypothetical protein